MKLTLGQVAEYAGGSLVRGNPDDVVSHIVTDSRTVAPGAGVFFALHGANFDGHDFLAEAGRRGAFAALVETGREDAAETLPNLIVVDDTLAALQHTAAAWREGFQGTVVGVTGSNGKTIVKEMLAAVSGSMRTTYRSPGSYNSQVGAPLAVLGIAPQHEVAVIEAGVSKPGEMDLLAAVIKPDVGVVTNIGMAHAAGFGTPLTTGREKLRLFRDMQGPLVFNADDDVLEALREELPAKRLGFGASPGADYRIAHVESQEVGHRFELGYPDGTSRAFELRIPGRHNVWNAAAALAVADVLGLDAESAAEALRNFALAEMRMEMHTTESGVTLLNDAYSSDPVSAAAALNALVHYAAGARTIAIIGDMLDLGAATEAAHRELGTLVATLGIDHLLCVGPLARQVGRAAVSSGMSLSNVWDTESTDRLDALLDRIVEPGDWVLLKGSRAVGLERAAGNLLESMAPARLYVDLGAIRNNVQAVRRAAGAGTGIMAVVKSYGYGNDANRVALTLVHAGVDAFCVAYPDEGIPLRRHGIKLPILVTNVRPSEVDKVVKYGLTPIVFGPDIVDALEAEAARRGRIIDVHVEVDTGMRRLGVEPAKARALCHKIAKCEHLRFDGVMTHFAAADDPSEDVFTLQQIAAFDQVLAELDADGIRPRVAHAANTAAAWRFPRARYDLIRLGLGLYGLHPSEEVGAATSDVVPAMQFVTEIIDVRDVEPGVSVGYGRTWRATERRRVATIAVGYNDGFPRFMSNGGEVLVRGVRCPVVGNVCMDVSMVDVTDVPDAVAGDEVVLFGAQGGARIEVEEIARRGSTISYEILTNISARVRRVFRR